MSGWASRLLLLLRWTSLRQHRGRLLRQNKTRRDGKVRSRSTRNICTVLRLYGFFLAYYNAGSAALVLVLVLLAIGLFFYFRSRKHQKKRIGLAREAEFAEESIPLHSDVHMNGRRMDERDDDPHSDTRQRKGKGREDAPPPPGRSTSLLGEAIFDVGEDGEDDDDDDHDGRHSDDHGY